MVTTASTDGYCHHPGWLCYVGLTGNKRDTHVSCIPTTTQSGVCRGLATVPGSPKQQHPWCLASTFVVVKQVLTGMQLGALQQKCLENAGMSQ